jgi:hypothetical protein
VSSSRPAGLEFQRYILSPRRQAKKYAGPLALFPVQARVVGEEPQKGVRVEQQPHSMYSRISSKGALKSAGTTSNPSYFPALGTPLTGGRGGGGRCRTTSTGSKRATGLSFSIIVSLARQQVMHKVRQVGLRFAKRNGVQEHSPRRRSEADRCFIRPGAAVETNA